jgi:hypothetical protein
MARKLLNIASEILRQKYCTRNIAPEILHRKSVNEPTRVKMDPHQTFPASAFRPFRESCPGGAAKIGEPFSPIF